MDVLVLGGTGFLGRHVAAALAARGHRVVVGGHAPRRDFSATLAGGYVRTPFERLTTPNAWFPLVRDYETVVNCVGILRPRGFESYGRVHVAAPAALAEACRHEDVARFVHVSALGLAPNARSGFIRSKWFGERAILATRAPTTIVRPSLLHGSGGFGSRFLARLAALPVHALPSDASGRIAIVDVRDVGEAIASVCESRTAPREAELGGPLAMTMRDYLAGLHGARGRPLARVIEVPRDIARVAAHACDALHATPYSLGHLELMRRDNVPRPNSLPALIGRAPRPVVPPAIESGRRSARSDALDGAR